MAPRAWVQVGKVQDFPYNGGATIKYGKVQIAVFNFTSRAPGMPASRCARTRRPLFCPAVFLATPMAFPKSPAHCTQRRSLWTQGCLSGDDYAVQVFPVQVEGDDVYLELPPTEVLDKLGHGNRLPSGDLDDTTLALREHHETHDCFHCRASPQLVVVLGLGCGILLGSRNLRNYDPTLLIYTLGLYFRPSPSPTAIPCGCNVRRRVCTGVVLAVALAAAGGRAPSADAGQRFWQQLHGATLHSPAGPEPLAGAFLYVLGHDPRRDGDVSAGLWLDPF